MKLVFFFFATTLRLNFLFFNRKERKVQSIGRNQNRDKSRWLGYRLSFSGKRRNFWDSDENSLRHCCI